MAQIGTIRLETQNSGTVSVPVFNTGGSGSSVYEFVRVQTAGGVGFIPVVDPAEASFPYLRVQSQNQGVVAVHSESSLVDIPTDDFARYLMESGSGTTFEDAFGNDGSHDGTYETSPAIGDFSLRLDVSDSATIPHTADHSYDTQAGGDSLTVSFFAQVLADDGTPRVFNKWDEITGAYPLVIRLSTSNGVSFAHYDGSNEVTYRSDSLDMTTFKHVAFVIDQSDTTVSIYIDGNLEHTENIDTSIGSTNNSNTMYIGQRDPSLGDSSNSVILDSLRFYDRALSASEISDLAQEQ